MSLVYCYKSRGISKDITIKNGSGAVITPAGSDKVRIVIGRVGQIGADLSGALFTVTSGEPSVAGSSITLNYPSSGVNRLRLDSTDLAGIPAGPYTMLVDFFDDTEGEEWKCVDRQCLFIEDL